jgi:putative spermidine/putrescine transport system permease protein
MSGQAPVHIDPGPAIIGPGDASEPASSSAPRRIRWSKVFAWTIFVIAAIYFLLPLIATLNWSLKARPPWYGYEASLNDPRFWSSLLFSFAMAILTIIGSIALLLPTAYWVRLRLPRLRPAVEFVTLLPFVIPPIVLVFGLIRIYSKPPLPLTHTVEGSNVLLVAGYVVLSLPYMYRAIDTGLAAIDIRTLTEAAQSLGAGWPTIVLRVILPNVRVAIVSGAFLTLAIVLGELVLAQYLARPAFGPYLSEIGRNKTFEPAAVSLIAFGLTWMAMFAIAFVGRKQRTRVTVVGGR